MNTCQRWLDSISQGRMSERWMILTSFFIRNIVDCIVNFTFQHFTDTNVLFLVFSGLTLKHAISLEELSFPALPFTLSLFPITTNLTNIWCELGILIFLLLELLTKRIQFSVVLIEWSPYHAVLLDDLLFEFRDEIVKMIDLLAEVGTILP